MKPLILHSSIIATSLAATIAVGLAGASIYADTEAEIAEKADRLVTLADADQSYLTVETRQDGVSVMTRVPIAN